MGTGRRRHQQPSRVVVSRSSGLSQDPPSRTGPMLWNIKNYSLRPFLSFKTKSCVFQVGKTEAGHMEKKPIKLLQFFFPAIHSRCEREQKKPL